MASNSGNDDEDSMDFKFWLLVKRSRIVVYYYYWRTTTMRRKRSGSHPKARRYFWPEVGERLTQELHQEICERVLYVTWLGSCSGIGTWDITIIHTVLDKGRNSKNVTPQWRSSLMPLLSRSLGPLWQVSSKPKGLAGDQDPRSRDWQSPPYHTEEVCRRNETNSLTVQSRSPIRFLDGRVAWMAEDGNVAQNNPVEQLFTSLSIYACTGKRSVVFVRMVFLIDKKGRRKSIQTDWDRGRCMHTATILRRVTRDVWLLLCPDPSDDFYSLQTITMPNKRQLSYATVLQPCNNGCSDRIEIIIHRRIIGCIK